MDTEFPACYYQIRELWDEENLSRYEPDGYHPVHLGDLFKEGLSNRRQHQWVSLKILTAAETESREAQMLRALQKDSSIQHVVRLLDSFVHAGPNGNHQCLVLELLGPSVGYVVSCEYNEPGERLEVAAILRITKQLLQALASLHKAGYAQGDVSARNIAFTASCFEDCSEERLTEIIGPPKTEELRPVDGEPLKDSLPKYLVESTRWDDWLEEDNEDICLIDWGQAFARGAEPAKIAQPFGLNAPETVFTPHIDYRIDLWRAGWIIYFLIFSQKPFLAYGIDGLIGNMIDFIEELPTEWRPKWEEIKRTTRNGLDHILEDEKQEVPRLEQKFRDSIHDPELQGLLPIMQGLMRFLPENRISASDALKLLEESPVQSQDEI
ncbi:hypothetical protein KVR01_013428 [Diaporthe batatas]|uniref:uncharacterized protein n=1 Tax=Diaporthe batatas TaxID=748121 RepID=UPI001D041CD3|nr:uncharacterized protein KVR01_013428 [Diaporthe batatas]KAG8156637.1 hypothetical protein KVR01_013428 [Diaporthe batatas]